MTTTSNLISSVRLFHVKHAASVLASWAGTTPAMTMEVRSNSKNPSISILFTNTQPCKDLPEHLFDANPPDNTIHRRGRASQILCNQLRLLGVRLERRGERLARVVKTPPVPFQRQQSRLSRRHALFGQFRNSVKQPVNPSARSGRYGQLCRARQRVSLLKVDLGPHRQCGRVQTRRAPDRLRRRSSQSIRSALSARRRALATPSCSIGSCASRMPAVSTRMTG